MTYDFTTTHKRFRTGSGKWDELTKYGVKETDDIIPFSVADMEFVTAPEIVEALKKELDTSIMGYANPTRKQCVHGYHRGTAGHQNLNGCSALTG